MKTIFSLHRGIRAVPPRTAAAAGQPRPPIRCGGPAFWKANAYAPYPVWLWLNGHERAKRQLAVPGAGLDGVHYLRTAADSDRIREAFQDAARVTVIGAG